MRRLSAVSLALVVVGTVSSASCGKDSAAPENSGPSVHISAPTSDANIWSDSLLTLEGSATDPEDGPLTGDALRWSSDLDGYLGKGTSVQVRLRSGSHHIILRGTDSEGLAAEDELVVSVLAAADHAPNAAFQFTPQTPMEGDTVTFDGSSSTDPDGDVLSYAWDFDGDGVSDASGTTAEHVFSGAGDHAVELTVRDPTGLTGRATSTLTARARLDLAIQPRYLAAGEGYTCALDANGATVCWGWPDFATTREIQRPLPTGNGHVFVQISGGRHHACGLEADGLAFCWGPNYAGELGSGAASGSAPASSPVSVAGDHRFAQISASSMGHTCAVDQAGTTYCWGENSRGQIGDSTMTDRAAPAEVFGGHAFTEIATGREHTCAIDASGAAWCWGDNAFGQIGDVGVQRSWIPRAVTGGRTFVHITAGTYHSCGLEASGSAYCWGDNSFGQLGDGTETGSSTPVAVSGGRAFVEITAGEWHTCGRTADGAVFCWGKNDRGQLGDGSRVDRASPVQVGVSGSIGVEAGRSHTCVIGADRAVSCWGDNAYGQLGAHQHSSGSLVPSEVAGGHSFSQIAGGGIKTCGLLASGEAYCWGGTGPTSLDVDGDTLLMGEAPVEVPGGLTFASLSGGGAHMCGLDGSGAAFCWGDNSSGQLGLGDGSWMPTWWPAEVVGGHAFDAVAAGGEHTCAVDATGAAYCWGSDRDGQLGDGSDGGVSGTPVAVTGDTSFAAVASGGRHTCGLDPYGTGWCWGSNASGELGIGDAAPGPFDAPVQVVGGHTFTTLAADSFRTCGIDQGGSAYCWGSGTLGDGGSTGSTTPVQVAGGHSFSALAVGADRICGVDTDGFAYCWGDNDIGQLGDGTTTGASTPVQVAGDRTYVDIVIGRYGTCALATGGAAWCWGGNFFGDLGGDVLFYSTVPVTTGPFD